MKHHPTQHEVEIVDGVAPRPKKTGWFKRTWAYLVFGVATLFGKKGGG